MRKFIEVTAIDLRSERAVEAFEADAAASPLRPTEEVIGEDDLERPITQPVTPPPAPVLQTNPMIIFEDQVREFYPRKHGRTGTRIVYLNGAAQVVQETYDEVKAKFASLTN